MGRRYFTFTGTILRKPGTWLLFQGTSVYVWHMINYWIFFTTFLPRWWSTHLQGPSLRHLWLASLTVFFPINGDCVSTSSISPGQGLRLMEGKFSLTQFSPREQEVLTNVLPHYGQGHSTHPRRPVLGARGPLPSAPSHTSDRVRRQWTRLPFHCVPAFPLHTSLQNILLAEVPAEGKEHVISRELKKMVRDKAHLTVSRCLLLSWSDL